MNLSAQTVISCAMACSTGSSPPHLYWLFPVHTLCYAISRLLAIAPIDSALATAALSSTELHDDAGHILDSGYSREGAHNQHRTHQRSSTEPLGPGDRPAHARRRGTPAPTLQHGVACYATGALSVPALSERLCAYDRKLRCEELPDHRTTEHYGRSSSHGMLVRQTRKELLPQ